MLLALFPFLVLRFRFERSGGSAASTRQDRMNASRLGFMVEGTQGAVRRLAEQDARWYMHAVYSIPSNPKKPQPALNRSFGFMRSALWFI